MSTAAPVDFEWLVSRRCDAQRFLLDLHNFGSGRDFVQQETERAVFEILIGVSFALWRTVFLVERDRPRDSVTPLGISFLERLIRDNAIGYAQERDTRQWSGGYYLNDVYLRLRLINEFRAAHSSAVPREQSEPIDAYFTILIGQRGMTSLQERWNVAFDVAVAMLNDLRGGPSGANDAA